MKKVLKFLLPVVLLVLTLAFMSACNNNEEEDAEDYASVSAAEYIQIALIGHSPESILNDGSFNEGAWEGVAQFLEDHDLPSTHLRFYQAVAPDDDARFNIMIQAIDGGANVLVLPGFQHGNALYDAQDLYPDVHFIILDGVPGRDGNTRIESNVAAVIYAEAEAGFLAGYAAVMEGYTALGFMGGNPAPAVIRFGHGFIQGAEHAAHSLGLEEGSVEVNFHYLGSFAPAPEHVVTASTWIVSGTELIFAAAGGAGMSVIAGVYEAGGISIGVDVDQHWVNDSVMTSAMKALGVSVHNMLTDILNDTFPGGELHFYNAAIDGVGLPMQSSRFETFTQAQYDAIFNQIASGALVVNTSENMADILADLSIVVVNEM